LERLDEKTLAQVLKETRRVITENGNLVIKVLQKPDTASKSSRDGSNHNRLITMIENAGFRMRSMNADEICARFTNIENISDNKNKSFYCHGVPK
jgi:hypothetical protein